MALDAAGTLTTSTGHRLNRLTPASDLFLNRSTVLYGPSGSGKTVIVKNIMRLLAPHIDMGIFVSPSELSNRSYSDCVPRPLLHYQLYLPDASGGRAKNDERKGAIRFLEAIWARAEMMAAVHARASDAKVLCSLYGRLPAAARAAVDRRIAAMNAQRARLIARLEAKYRADPGRAAEKVREASDLFRAWLVRVYKASIAPHAALLARQELSADESFSLTNIRFNPRQLLVFDDCADQLKGLFKHEIFRKFFYRGRHNHVTIIICCQDDTDLDTNLRKNAFVTIFTEAQVALSNFTRASNKFSKPTQAMVGEIIGDVFAKEHRYRKLVYIREDPRRVNFYHVTFDCPPPFVFGSAAVQDLCREVEARDTPIDQNNIFYSAFHPA
ncbi:MAG TPA: ATP-binding protein [Elusimicrobiota bacterium]|jgi:hypothetical protein|nr:ATP-binding protein [Elusimicrobiota bacterium]